MIARIFLVRLNKSDSVTLKYFMLSSGGMGYWMRYMRYYLISILILCTLPSGEIERISFASFFVPNFEFGAISISFDSSVGFVSVPYDRTV